MMKTDHENIVNVIQNYMYISVGDNISLHKYHSATVRKVRELPYPNKHPHSNKCPLPIFLKCYIDLHEFLFLSLDDIALQNWCYY